MTLRSLSEPESIAVGGARGVHEDIRLGDVEARIFGILPASSHGNDHRWKRRRKGDVEVRYT